MQGPVGPAGPQGPSGAAGSLGPTGGIVGSLACDGSPSPAGTLVYIPGRAFTAFTGASGTFQFNHVPAGTYSLAVDIAGQTVATVNGVAVGSVVTALLPITACDGPAAPLDACGGYPLSVQMYDSQTPSGLGNPAAGMVGSTACDPAAPWCFFDPNQPQEPGWCGQCRNYDSSTCFSTEYNLCNNNGNCECGENYECGPGLVCHVNGYFCGGCNQDSDCGNGNTCQPTAHGNRCTVPGTACVTNADCATQVPTGARPSYCLPDTNTCTVSNF